LLIKIKVKGKIPLQKVMTSFFVGSRLILFQMKVSLLSSGSAKVMMMLVLMVWGMITLRMMLPIEIPLRLWPPWMWISHKGEIPRCMANLFHRVR
jgi:hypothetical protein